MAGGEPRAVGVAGDGSLPLPWLREPLTQALRLDRSHALLVHAPQDVGQLDLALTLAQAWLCEQTERRAVRPLRSLSPGAPAQSHPDLLIVVPEALRLQFEWLGEDDPLLRTHGQAEPRDQDRADSRGHRMDAAQRWLACAGAALVMHPAEAINPTAANALLKTLEEPPGRLRIVIAGGDPDAPAAHPAQPRAARAHCHTRGSAGVDVARQRKVCRRRTVRWQWPAAARWRRWRCMRRASTRPRSTACLVPWRAAMRRLCLANRCRW